MATGYTYDIANGELTDFSVFAKRCARAFIGSMRDAPADAPLPTVILEEPHYYESVKTARMQLATHLALTAEERDVAAEKFHQSVSDSISADSETKEVKRQRYDRMLTYAHDWNGPENLKEFMIEQLESSRRFDCGTETDATERVKWTTQEWFDFILEARQRTVLYAERSLKEHRERVSKANAWLKQFHAAL